MGKIIDSLKLMEIVKFISEKAIKQGEEFRIRMDLW